MTNDDGSRTVKSYSSRCRPMRIPAEGRLVRPAFIEDITPITNDTPLEETLGICLNNMGFGDTTGFQHDAAGGCFALKQHLQNCPTCRLSHALGSNYLVETLVNDCYTVRNEEKHCRSRIVNVKTMVEEHEGLSRILDHPTVDGPLANLYVAERGHNLTAIDDSVFRFNQGRWGVYEDPDLENDVREFLDKVLRGLVDLLHHEEGIEQQVNIRANLKSLQKLKDKFKVAAAVGECNTKRRAIVRTIKTKLHNSQLRGRWDSREDLLGLSAGVVDLNNGCFREADKEDYITMSCGYGWMDTVDPEVEAEVEEFISRVYPVFAEREFMQRYCYYSLLGAHREKIFLVLNDLRGGWNGKSTFLSLLLAAMGDYGIKADACVIYRQDRTRGINDHSGGLLAFEKKRLMVIEETSSGAIMDEVSFL